MIIDEEAHLEHYGILRRSGRYPWGSSGPEYASNASFLGMVDGLKKQGLSDVEIARGLGTTTSVLRAAKSIAKNEERQADIAMAQRLKEKGLSNVAIGERMKIGESQVRVLLAPGLKDKADVLHATANMLKEQVDKKQYVDIGVGVEHHLGISGTKLGNAVSLLREQGYEVHPVQVDQQGTGNKTIVKVLAPPGTKYVDVVKNLDKIQQIKDYSEDGGRSYVAIEPPLGVSPKRIGVRYAEQGGSDADGVIYIRPGVKDLSLNGTRYAQVRIAVGDTDKPTHYLKGMAMYKDDLPDGVDLLFNTNKSDTGTKTDAMKKISEDPENPFGAVVKQITEPIPGGKRKVVSAMNIVNEEGQWDKWNKSLSSQFLSKQSPALAKAQLSKVVDHKKEELDSILELNNPSVKKKLLEDFAEGADSAAVHLKAAALPRQSTHVILPVNSLRENEIYAPNYDNGERVVLIRHPHGGIFEIPELVVNNRNPQARKLLGDAKDAVGIHSKVAEKLSGADFDGDTVLVIPNNNGKVKHSPSLDGLKNFDPKTAFPPYDGMKTMGGGTWDAKKKEDVYPEGKRPSGRTKGHQMGLVSNLITDMTIKGASTEELARAVRHSMVVIDAEKHNLNYKLSSTSNGIPQLMKKYQGRAQGGSSTLISKAGSPVRVKKRKDRSAAKGGPVDPLTGKRVFEENAKSWLDVRGNTVFETTKVKKLAETDDAHTLSSGTLIESYYADHSNSLKQLANEARLASLNTKLNRYSNSAKIAYASEVNSLDAKLNLALRNAPLERQAQLLANAKVKQKQAANPEMDNAELKKIKGQALLAARTATGAGKERIEITDSEWDAIQAGAITPNKLSQILNNADMDRVKQLATPRSVVAMTPAKQAKARTLLKSGATRAEVAKALGVSVSTLKLGLSEGSDDNG